MGSIVQIIGRSSSHFTRVARIFALELGIPHELIPVYEPLAMDVATFGGNPALKIPALKRGASILIGTENICRALADHAGGKARIVWPEELRSDLCRNANEMLWHSMAAEVQLAMGVLTSKLPADNAFFAKIRAGFEGALGWLDQNLSAVLASLAADRSFSLFEVALFCLLEHLSFRGTLPVAPYPALVAFAKTFGQRPSAKQTPYAFDKPP